ncbi:uncharacterized protein LOC143063574 isoform X2 [Mytilus galloprovincialis]|uniref:uncharacterized protein LOC143063574 isoform X2 n=1 Tax=Mytilus galloprovincialis TaxID=29158 RepID=UPI003F7B4BEF
MTNFDNYIVHQLKDLQELRTRNFEGILASPRNLGQAPAQPLVWQDFRFKGYPDKSFQAPKVPKYKRLSLDLMNTERDDQYFGKTTHFDTDRYSVHPRQITKRAAARKNQSSQQNPLKISPHVDDKREEYPIRDPLGTLTDRSENRRYRIRDPYGDLTEEHKYKLQREMRDIEEDRKQRGIIDKLRTEERQEERQKPDNRKQKFLETDFEGSPTPSYRERMHAPYYRPIYRPFVDSFGKPGGGAPLRTKSGNIQTSIIGDMLIRFQEKDRQAVEERFRYNEDRGEQERYHQELAKQRNDQELRRQEDRLDNLQRELETVNLKTDQFGKPGGGAPNRTNSESFTERREKDTYDPWGKGYGNADRLADGRIKPRPNALEKDKKKSNFTGPFIHKSSKHNDPNSVKSKENRVPVTNITRDNRISTGRYSPFGKGYGHPERDRNGNVKGRKSTLDTNKPKDQTDSSPKMRKNIVPNEKVTKRDKTASPVVSLNHENKIDWSNNSGSPRWGYGIGNPQRNDDGKLQPRSSMLEKKKFGELTAREGTPETNINRDMRIPFRPGSPWGKGVGNQQYDSEGNVIAKKSMSLDKNKPTDANGSNAEMRKKGTYNPTQGLIVSPRRNHTPEIKLHSNRPTANNKEDYFPYGQGYGNPKRDDLGNVPRKMATLNANKPIGNLKGPTRSYEPSSLVYGGETTPEDGQMSPDSSNLNREQVQSPWGKGYGNAQRSSDGTIIRKSTTLDTNKPADGPSAEKKKKPYDPTAGGIVNSPRRKQTPDIKLNLDRQLPSFDENYTPWGSGGGNPVRDDDGYIQPRGQTLDATRPVDNGPTEKKKKAYFDPSSGNQPSARGSQTPDIKPSFNGQLPSNEGDFDPWGKGGGNPNYDETGNIKKKVSTLDSRRPPDGMIDESGNQLRRPKPMSDLSFMANRNRTQNRTPDGGNRISSGGRSSDPFGFGKGAGNPNYDEDGNVVRHSMTLTLDPSESSYDDNTRKRARAKEYYDFLRGQEEEQRRNKQEIEWHMKAPIGELASIMGSKNVGKPVKDPYTGELRNHHLGNSDVTLQKMNYQPKAETEKKKYHEDLSQLADERMRYRQLNRLKENQEGMLHQHTMDAMWGRPGGGAPKGYNLRKFNLESTLHHPTKDQTTEEYIKKKDWSQVPQEGNPFTQNDDNYSPRFQPNKYVRSTITSTHANLYEYPEHLKDKNYALSEPYATY